jgi:hypothetical protein
VPTIKRVRSSSGRHAREINERRGKTDESDKGPGTVLMNINVCE